MPDTQSRGSSFEQKYIEERHERFWNWYNKLPHECQQMVGEGMAYSDRIWANRYSDLIRTVAASTVSTFKSVDILSKGSSK